MQYVAQIQNRLVGLPTGDPKRPVGLASDEPPQNPQPIRPADQLDLSATAAENAPDDGETAARVARIRAAIQAGEYLTDDKIDVVVDRLHAEIFGK